MRPGDRAQPRKTSPAAFAPKHRTRTPPRDRGHTLHKAIPPSRSVSAGAHDPQLAPADAREQGRHRRNRETGGLLFRMLLCGAPTRRSWAKLREATSPLRSGSVVHSGRNTWTSQQCQGYLFMVPMLRRCARPPPLLGVTSCWGHVFDAPRAWRAPPRFRPFLGVAQLGPLRFPLLPLSPSRDGRPKVATKCTQGPGCSDPHPGRRSRRDPSQIPHAIGS